MTIEKRKQTWDLLEHGLGRIRYLRDERVGTPRFQLLRYDDENYAVLIIVTHNKNTYHPDQIRHTAHEFVVPVATYHEEAWIRWVFDRIDSIERHETCESFLVDGVRIYAPHHGNGWDPYTFWPSHDPSEKLKAPGDP